MSAEHTQGRLVADSRALFVPGGDGIMAHVESDADARRLAACWNACEGSDVEDLERLGADFIKPLIDLIDERDQLKAQTEDLITVAAHQVQQLEAARALLREVLTADDEALAELAALGMPPEVDTAVRALTERIRAHLDPPGAPA